MRILTLLFTLALISAPALADERSGPGRRTIVREGWGTVFFQPSAVRGDYEFSMNEDGNRYTLTSDDGEVVIDEDGDDVTLTYPGFKGSVVSEPDSIRVDWGGTIHVFTRAGDRMTYSGPVGEVVFTRKPKELLITGPKGEVRLKDGDGQYTVESPVGTTRLVTTPSGFKVSGVRLTQHPYLRRGAIFSHNGVGLYVELALLDPMNPLFRFLEWNTIIELESRGD